MTHAGRSIFDHPNAFIATGRALVDNDKGDKALALVETLRVERPGDPLLAALAAELLTRKVPDFHASMLADSARNTAYTQAIEALAPGKRVLDIGAGSGLLAMIAARAGAASVVACERDPMLAATAREIVAANGLADRVTVLALHSSELDRERDLAGGVDLVVSEIFAHDLLGEQVLASLAHARAELCRPGAHFLPAAASIHVALADFPDRRVALGDVEGFDLSAFERHVPRVHNVQSASPKLVLRSEPAELFRFDFNGEAPPLERGRARAVVRSLGGRVAGIAQWLRIEFAPGVSYENSPGSDDRHHWVLPLHAIDPRDTAAGEEITIGGWHDSQSLALWLDPDKR
jgi:type III protein arginine methyltransferase